MCFDYFGNTFLVSARHQHGEHFRLDVNGGYAACGANDLCQRYSEIAHAGPDIDCCISFVNIGAKNFNRIMNNLADGVVECKT